MTVEEMAARPIVTRRLRCTMRLLVLSVLAISVLVSFLTVMHPHVIGFTPLVTSTSGHSFHPKLCGSSLPGSSDSGIVSPVNASSSCSEVNDPRYALVLVPVPQQLKLVSQDPSMHKLQQQLQAAIDAGWPLPLARRLMRVMLNHLTLDGSFPKLAPLQAKHSGSPAGWKFLTQAMSLLAERGAGQFLPCRFDPSLPVTFQTRFLFSATVGPLAGRTTLPNMLLQLLHTVTLLPPGYAYVSIHAAAAGGPADDTLFFLDLLQLLLAPLAVPVHLVVDTKSASASQQASVSFAAHARNAAMAPFFPRPQPTTAKDSSNSNTTSKAGHRHLAGSSSSSGSSGSSRGGYSSSIKYGACDQLSPKPSCYQPEYVVFVDSVYFCAADVVRLMEYPEDLVCGINLMEFNARPGHHHKKAHRRRLQQRQQLQQQQQQQQQQQGLRGVQSLLSQSSSGSSLGRSVSAGAVQLRSITANSSNSAIRGQLCQLTALGAGCHHQHQQHQQQQHQGTQPLPSSTPTAAAPAGATLPATRRLQQSSVLGEGPMARAATAQAVFLKSDVPEEFTMKAIHATYDATRDIQGNLLTYYPPYLSHAASTEWAKAGLPFPVHCCWGGLAKMRAAPLAAGLRFRVAIQGECNTTETSLMCDDMHRAGYNKVVLDPGVRTSSQLRTKRLFATPRFPFFYYTKWETTAWFDVNPLLPLQFWANSSTDAGGGAAAAANVWAPGSHHHCCAAGHGSAARSSGRPGPSDCSKVASQGGTNYTEVFLQQCDSHKSGNKAGGVLEFCD